jgi:NAD(P)-dependent dehydrogenase (short-subunit alcohol dehydrogenase family)
MSKGIALVTGSSRGIGAATAISLAKKGYQVCVNYKNNSKAAEQVVNSIKNAGGDAFSVQADVASKKEIVKLLEKIDSTYGPIRYLVNNAGVNIARGNLLDVDPAEIEKTFETNVLGLFYLCREAIKRMKKNGNGHIVNVSSEAAKFGGNKIVAYAASKAAVNTFTIGLAREVAEYNIRVNAVSPGIIDTDMHSLHLKEHKHKLTGSIPMRRMGNVDEVAQMICWLLVESPAYLSGSIIPITGGR